MLAAVKYKFLLVNSFTNIEKAKESAGQIASSIFTHLKGEN